MGKGDRGVISLVGASRTFKTRRGQVDALSNVDLKIHDGEFVAIIGRSGCGKSTLLRLIAGLLPPTSGQVLIDDLVVTKPRRDVSVMFQRSALLPWRSVLANIMLPAEIMGLPKAELRKRAIELINTTGLTGFERRLPHELSGGMQQRVAMCRALLVQPRIMLMDEPFSALDALTREELAAELQKIHMNLRPTTVFVTHSIQEAVLLADRVIVMSPRPGRIRTIMDIRIPRPRAFTHNAHLEEVASASAELHELLLE
jgi:NitT/TauT family transport system ATP-binding protein